MLNLRIASSCTFRRVKVCPTLWHCGMYARPRYFRSSARGKTRRPALSYILHVEYRVFSSAVSGFSYLSGCPREGNVRSYQKSIIQNRERAGKPVVYLVCGGDRALVRCITILGSKCTIYRGTRLVHVINMPMRSVSCK